MPDEDNKEIAHPRDQEAEEGEDEVEAGFTTTGVNGSSGGRAVYGMDKTEKHKPTNVEEDFDPGT